MKDTRRSRLWTLAGVCVLALAAGAASQKAFARRAALPAPAVVGADEDLRDAVAAPMTPVTAGLAGKPVPTSWFKTPGERRAEMDAALLSSRRRRARSRRGAAAVAAQ